MVWPRHCAADRNDPRCPRTALSDRGHIGTAVQPLDPPADRRAALALAGALPSRRMTAEHPFDIDAFLGRPLLARVAAAGPSVRPVWFLWEDGAFWWITGAYARLPKILTSNPRVALVVDSCHLRTGEVRQVTARGDAVVVHFDPERARRKLVRYLGRNEDNWDPRFSVRYLSDPDQARRLVRLAPTQLTATDLSFSVDGGGASR